jgi:purine-cytosine permease-like protein
VPRLFWPFFISAIYIPLAIVGADSFSSALENFLNVLGYWLAIYSTVVIEEHLIFRRRKYENYNAAETWNRSDLLPWGLAAVIAAGFGVMGAVLGMAQIWYIGKIGALVGGDADPFGGDIGFELALAFTAITYPILRYGEKRFLHR